MMMNFNKTDRVALIDADTIMWLVAYNNRDESVSTVQYKTYDFVSSILKATNASHYAGFISAKQTFRNKYPSYKAKRPDNPDYIVKWKNIIIDYMVNELKFVQFGNSLTPSDTAGIEADDAVAYAQLQLFDVATPILCSSDKDLNQIKGKHYDYKKIVHYEVEPWDASKCLWMQVLQGDTTDNIEGLPKVGPVTANDILTKSSLPFPETVKNKYKQVHGDLIQFVKMYTLVKMLTPTTHPGLDFVQYVRPVTDLSEPFYIPGDLDLPFM